MFHILTRGLRAHYSLHNESRALFQSSGAAIAMSSFSLFRCFHTGGEKERQIYADLYCLKLDCLDVHVLHQCVTTPAGHRKKWALWPWTKIRWHAIKQLIYDLVTAVVIIPLRLSDTLSAARSVKYSFPLITPSMCLGFPRVCFSSPNDISITGLAEMAWNKSACFTALQNPQSDTFIQYMCPVWYQKPFAFLSNVRSYHLYDKLYRTSRTNLTYPPFDLLVNCSYHPLPP